MADRPGTFIVLFLSQVLSWAGVPALGGAALAATGVLASQGEVRLWAVLVFGVAGGQTGGLAGWWIGTRLSSRGSDGGGRLSQRWRSARATGERLADRWGGLIVFFVPAWVAGTLGMPLRRFAAWNVFAVAAWTLGSALSAYGLGATFTGRTAVDGVVPIAVAVCAGLVTVAVFIRRRRARGG